MLLFNEFAPAEVAFVKPITVNGKPTEQGIKARKKRLDTPVKEPQSGERPSCAYVGHVDVARGRAVDKLA